MTGEQSNRAVKRVCIGGPFHGETVEVRDGVTEVRIPIPGSQGRVATYTPGHDGMGRALLVFEPDADA